MRSHIRRLLESAGFSPRQLFAALQGAWLEPKQGLIWQENTGVTPTTTGGQTIGLMLDQSQGAVLGPELITNGDFSNGTTGWTTAVNASISGGEGKFTNAVFADGSVIAQNIQTIAGNTYQIQFTISNYSSGTLRLDKVGLAGLVTGITANGTYTASYVALSTSSNAFQFSQQFGAGNLSVSIDNISIREILGNHAYQDTAANRPTYQLDSNGLPLARHDTTDSLSVSLPNLGSGVYSASGSVYFATPVGMSALHNQSMGTTYTLPALSSDIYSWMVFPQRLSAVQESQLQRYMLQKSGLAAPDYLYPDNDIYGYLLDDASEILLSDPPFTAVYGAGLNDIGIAGAAGFGVGICPNVPAGFIPIAGCTDPYSDGYGNYAYSDNSVMVWVPAFYYKWGTGSNGLGVNVIDIKAYSAYVDVATANAAGYALHRAFYDGGSIQAGFFIDKYQVSNNGGVASSIKMGNPLSSNSAHNPFSGLTGTPANFYYGAIAAAKTRGAQFFPTSRFIHAAMAMLSYAHAQASSSTTYCAWYGSTTNYPKGNNNNALRDTNDTSVIWVSDGYSNAGKTGSAGFGGGSGNVFAKSTHNGQNCGVADLNGNMWEINLGLTSDGTNIYVMNTAVAMKSVTSGNTLATDAWGATGIAAMYTSLGATYEALTKANGWVLFGSANQVLVEATSGNGWALTGAGIPKSGGTGGSNAFGQDGNYQPAAWPRELCPRSGGPWADGSYAGVWALYLGDGRGNSSHLVGFRSGMYL